MSAEYHHGHGHHHDQLGWVRAGGRRGRWLEPFLLLLVAEGEAHGYELIARLNELGVSPGGVDVGMAYRTLREFEAERLVSSEWETASGAPRREYRLTRDGRVALAEWASVMCERGRLINEFMAREARLEEDEGG
jgi:PadR family transcriptional regulator, regulatory protein PadR